jgi:hypothetical protein
VASLQAGRIVSAVHAWREWHTWAERDPSGADAYRMFFVVDIGVMALTFAIAGLVWWLLRSWLPEGHDRRNGQ